VSAARRKLILVSNRGPAAFTRDEEGARTVSRGAGGLATALRGLVRYHDVTWIASAMSDEDRLVVAESSGGAVEQRARDGSPYRLRLVAHEPEAFGRFYCVVSNPILWFLQHYLFDLPRSPALGPEFTAAWADGYVAVNAAFADAVLTELEGEPDSAVFFQDYHLYLAPRFVRDRHEDAALAHFVHIPWPQPDYWRVLPEPVRVAIHDGLLANDLVGFHTDRWRESFLLSCADVLGAERDGGSASHRGRTTRVVARPISVDPGEFDELAGEEEVAERAREIRANRPERLVVRVDRTDPSKNILRGFEAFALYLERRPEMQGRVGMLALLDPSRQEIPEYEEYLVEIELGARAVNERFAREGWKPIDLRIEDDLAWSLAAYMEYDVLLVNAVYDGLNLVAKEAPLVNRRDGVLILSENAGAHEELEPWVISVNPFDVAAQAQAIHVALELPHEERRARLEGIREHVRAHDQEGWVNALLADLDRVAMPSGG
jgi:trehalose 6-phosphate synthase